MPTPRFLPLALLALGATVLPACDSDDPGDGAGDEELITRVEVTLTPVGGGSPVTLIATDDNGDGVGIEYGDRGMLDAGTSYTGSVRLLDERNNVNVTDDIEGEAEEHLFAYSSSVSGVTVAITDSESDYPDEDGDSNGGDFNVGLAFRVDVAEGASGTGTLSATLYHFDEGPKTGNNDTSDETDVELAFPISVQ